MKAWVIGSREGISSLHLAERSEPVAGEGQLLVRVEAAGLNFRDLMVLRGEYGADLPETRIPLSDGVGVVEAVGAGVTGFSEGDRVIAPHFLSWLEDERYGLAVFAQDMGVTVDGWLTEKLVLPATAAIKVPKRIDDLTAASLAVVGATVWHAMVVFGGASHDKLVLAQGTGGVSIGALLIAKALGARCAITSSSEAKLAKVRALGADYAINYRSRPDWANALLEETDGRGADIIVDTLGFAAFGETVRVAAVNGRIGTLGALAGSPKDRASASQSEIIAKNLTIKGIASGSKAMLEQAVALFASAQIAMPIDRVFSYAEAPAAYRHIEKGAHLGKVVIRVSGD